MISCNCISGYILESNVLKIGPIRRSKRRAVQGLTDSTNLIGGQTGMCVCVCVFVYIYNIINAY